MTHFQEEGKLDSSYYYYSLHFFLEKQRRLQSLAEKYEQVNKFCTQAEKDQALYTARKFELIKCINADNKQEILRYARTKREFREKSREVSCLYQQLSGVVPRTTEQIMLPNKRHDNESSTEALTNEGNYSGEHESLDSSIEQECTSAHAELLEEQKIDIEIAKETARNHFLKKEIRKIRKLTSETENEIEALKSNHEQLKRTIDQQCEKYAKMKFEFKEKLKNTADDTTVGDNISIPGTLEKNSEQPKGQSYPLFYNISKQKKKSQKMSLHQLLQEQRGTNSHDKLSEAMRHISKNASML